jgi:hypothetical protein
MAAGGKIWIFLGLHSWRVILLIDLEKKGGSGARSRQSIKM